MGSTDTMAGIAQSLATLTASKLLHYFELDNTMYGSLHTLLHIIIGCSVVYLAKIISYVTGFRISFDIYNLGILIVAMGIILMVGYLVVFKNSLLLRFNQTQMLKIYDFEKIKLFYKYTRRYQDFYSVPYVTTNGNSLLVSQYRKPTGADKIVKKKQYDEYFIWRPAYNENIIFDDKNYNIKGKYRWCCTNGSDGLNGSSGSNRLDGQNEMIEYIIFEVSRGPYTAALYFDKIIEHISKIIAESTPLSHIKILPIVEDETINDTCNMCNSLELKMENRIWFDTFFHIQKSYIKGLIDSVNNKQVFYDVGQIPRLGLLLYGPPGTGKSNFAYRLAKYLNRHIITLDLAGVTKDTLFQVLKRPYINGITEPTDKVVFLFDEFDSTIFELNRINKMKKLMFKHVYQLLKSQKRSGGRHHSRGGDSRSGGTIGNDSKHLINVGKNEDKNNGCVNDQNKENNIDKNKIITEIQKLKHRRKHKDNQNNDIDNNDINEDDDGDDCEDDNNEDSTTEDVSNKNSDNVNKKSISEKFSTETNKFNAETKILNECMRKNKVQLDDLLEIFQGAVPLDGSIFIATTNKYDEIKKLCPALFRHGRLTPIYFGYFDGRLIKEICKQFYNEEPKIDDDYEPGIINSKVMEWVALTKNLPNGYQIFMEYYEKHRLK